MYTQSILRSFKVSMSAQAHRPSLLLFKGHPATGKSTLANALARRLGWPLIDKDDIKDHIYALPQGGHLAYVIMWQIVRHQLEVGLSVIVDSPLSYPSAYVAGSDLAHEFGARLVVVETRTADEVWRARLDHRLQEAQTHRTSGWSGMQQLLVRYDGVWNYAIPPQQHLVLDTALPALQNVQTIVDYLGRDELAR